MSADNTKEQATVEPAGVSDNYGTKRLRRALEDALAPRTGMQAGMPKATVDPSHLAHHLSQFDALRQQLAELRRDRDFWQAQSATFAELAGSHEQQLAEMRGAAQDVIDSGCSVPAPYIGNANDPVNDLRIVSGRRLEKLRAALAPTSQPGKCERCSGTGEVRYEFTPYGDPNGGPITAVTYCPDCKPAADCAQPERQGVIPEILNELIGEGKYRYNLNDDQISALRELIKPSPPPTDDIVAGLRAARDRLAVRSFKIEADSVDRAIAALETRK